MATNLSVDSFNLTPSDCEIEILLDGRALERLPCHKRILSISSVLNAAQSLMTDDTLNIRLRSEDEVMAFKDLIHFFYNDNLDHVEQTEEAMLRLMNMADQYGSSICMLAVMEHPLVSADNF